jgi:hypothetical protein
VDAANAEVKAFRAAGLKPDPLVVRIAGAESRQSTMAKHVPSGASGSSLSEVPNS